MGKKTILTSLLWFCFLFLVILNFVSAFVPEIGFDALWYHLTLPKLWLLKKQWYFSGGLLYYSTMPRLTEIIFIPLISLLGYIGPKLLQFISGLSVCYLLSQIAKQHGFNQKWRLIAINLFYLTWLVSWQSSSGYIDLFRTLLETIALYNILNKHRYLGAVFLGLAIGTKWLSLGSVLIYAFIFGFNLLPISLVIALPWFLIAFFLTHNPIYPIFSSYLPHQNLNVLTIFQNILLLPAKITLPFDDFISPVAGLLVSLSAINYLFEKDNLLKKVSLLAVFGAIFSVVLNPPSSRFFLPFLPAAAIGASALVIKSPVIIKKLSTWLFLISFLIILCMRIYAFKKNLPFLLGHLSVNQYLSSLSLRLPGTFIDSDDYVRNNLQGQKILIDTIHNLYYFPYNFDHTSWITDQTGYDYLVTSHSDPQSINGQLVHTNSVGIQIYKLNK